MHLRFTDQRKSNSFRLLRVNWKANTSYFLPLSLKKNLHGAAHLVKQKMRCLILALTKMYCMPWALGAMVLLLA